jgi:hypothetical protein
MLLNITIASFMMMATTAIHAGGIGLVVIFIRNRSAHWATRHPLDRMRAISSVVLLMFTLSLLEMTAWAAVYLYVGALGDLETAMYFSTVTFTTLGYGDILLDANWRLLAAFESANGIIIFGLTTAVVVSAVQLVYFSKPTRDDT